MPKMSESEILKARSPLRVLRIVALTIAISLIGGVAIPGFISYREGVFYSSQIRNKLQGDPRTRLEQYESQKKQIEDQISQIDAYFVSPPAAQSVDTGSLITLRNQLQQQLDKLRPPIYLSGFYFNRLMLLWPIFYISMGLLILLIDPKEGKYESFIAQLKRTIPILLVLVPLYRWPTWARNAFFNKEGRVVYAASNFDIAPWSFLTQEIQALFLAFLVAYTWQQWLSSYSSLQQQLKSELRQSHEDSLKDAFDQRKLQRLSTTFFKWQVASVLLCIAFIGYTDFFWYYVIVIGDQRYLVHALIIHSMWAVTWIIISLPLFVTWYAWYSNRARAVSTLIFETNTTKVSQETALRALSELQPIGFVNITTSGLLAVFSFVLPVIQSLIKSA